MNDKQLKALAMTGDFIFHSSWFEIFKSFDMATAYAIFMAMIAYVQTGAVPADEELRRLTVFLFAHIDTDRERLLALQPKRRTTAKKKPDAEPPSPETEPSLDLPAEPTKQQPDKAPLSETPATSDTSITSTPPQSSHNSQSKPNGALTPRMRADGAHNPLCGPRMRAARRARFLHYVQKVSAAINHGELHPPKPVSSHDRKRPKSF